jgi:hypothetical protein
MQQTQFLLEGSSEQLSRIVILAGASKAGILGPQDLWNEPESHLCCAKYDRISRWQDCPALLHALHWTRASFALQAL